jgi:hypothetical protein
MKNIVRCLVVGSLIIARQLFAADVCIYQEPLGSSNSYPAAVATWQYVGVKFQVAQPVEITSLHGVMGDSPSSFFAALVPLSSISSLPQGNPFAAGEVMYSTVFNLSWDYLTPRDIPFDVTIDPGAYAIIFGAGQFGSPSYGLAGVISTYSKVPNSTGFAWDPDFAPNWHDTGLTWDVSVYGQVVPEPSFIVLIGSSGLIFAVGRKCAVKRKGPA